MWAYALALAIDGTSVARVPRYIEYVVLASTGSAVSKNGLSVIGSARWPEAISFEMTS